MAGSRVSANPWDNPDIFGPWKEPVFAIVFGDFGVGKSYDATLCAPDAYTLSAPGALKGVRETVGDEWYNYIMNFNFPVETLDDITDFLLKIAAGTIERRPVRLDDLTIAATNTLAQLNAVYTEQYIRQKFEDFKRRVYRLKEAARRAGVHVIASNHIQAPSTSEKGVFTRGGPAMGAPSACPPVYASADIIYRAEVEVGRFPHPLVYRCDYPNNAWAYKDRHGVLSGVGPANLREILLHAGMQMPRPDYFAWMDEYVEAVAQEIIGGADKREVWNRHREYLQKNGVYKGHIYWVLRDGLDRASLRLRRSPMDLLLAGDFGTANSPAGPAMPPKPAKKK